MGLGAGGSAAYNARMPVPQFSRRSETAAQWFLRPEGRVVLESEQTVVADALSAHPVVGLPWLWLAPVSQDEGGAGRGLRLALDGQGWSGAIRCAAALPLASESLGAVVLQHVLADDIALSRPLIEDCARLLVPGGRLTVLGLNPLSPYRLRWRRCRPDSRDPAAVRRMLVDAGLAPDAEAGGIGPQWAPTASPTLQSGVGLRAAYVQRAEKRAIPLSPLRPRRALPVGDGVPAT